MSAKRASRLRQRASAGGENSRKVFPRRDHLCQTPQRPLRFRGGWRAGQREDAARTSRKGCSPACRNRGQGERESRHTCTKGFRGREWRAVSKTGWERQNARGFASFTIVHFAPFPRVAQLSTHKPSLFQRARASPTVPRCACRKIGGSETQSGKPAKRNAGYPQQQPRQQQSPAARRLAHTTHTALINF